MPTRGTPAYRQVHALRAGHAPSPSPPPSPAHASPPSPILAVRRRVPPQSSKRTAPTKAASVVKKFKGPGKPLSDDFERLAGRYLDPAELERWRRHHNRENAPRVSLGRIDLAIDDEQGGEWVAPSPNDGGKDDDAAEEISKAKKEDAERVVVKQSVGAGQGLFATKQFPDRKSVV